MKELEELHVAIIDAGTFVPLAEMFGKVCARTSYNSPYEQEYLSIERCCIGDGMAKFDRVDDYMEPSFFNSVDLWVFPDIGFGGLQRYLRSLGKPVFGSMGASDLELYRTRFLKVLKECGLPVVKSVVCRGVTALSEHLKTVENKWVKVNRYRDNMETWHHLDYQHSERELERLASVFGPLKGGVVFVVQDPIEGDEDSPVLEMGYDGWMITAPDGSPLFPESSFQGYEKKNQLYLGAETPYTDLPEAILTVNEKFAPVLAEYGYRNFVANEIRVKDKVPHFIDPTDRMAGQTMEHLLRTCTNLPKVIWKGAHGELVKPEFEKPFAAEATIHYHSNDDGGGWKTFRMPEEAEDWVSLYRFCYKDGAYHFPPHKCDELGVVSGSGDTVEEALNDMKEHFELIKDEPVSIELSGFADLLKQIEDAKKEGVPFSDKPLPDAKIALET